jgi:predicted transcriptional regulator
MYIEIEFNLLYQVEKLAKRSGRSVTEIVNEAVAQYVEREHVEEESSPSKPDDAP